jgi:hypothetical protein
MAGPTRKAWIALGFALAALFSSWSPLAAPFGLLTGLGAAALALRARRAGGRAWLAGLALALLAVTVSTWVLARGGSPGPSVPAASRALPVGAGETSRRLDAEAEQSRAARERAVQQAEPPPGPRTRN